jgi:hypothetical protein
VGRLEHAIRSVAYGGLALQLTTLLVAVAWLMLFFRAQRTGRDAA